VSAAVVLDRTVEKGKCKSNQPTNRPTTASFCRYILADDDAVVAHPLHVAEAERRAADARAYAHTVAEGAARRAADALGAGRVAWHVLTPRGDGPADVGGALAEYAGQQLHGALVLGSRGQGAAKRALLSLVGLGSVSDWCAKHAGVPVAVVRPGATEQ
jgi:nucleotide-binding universal stress UspA family protein